MKELQREVYGPEPGQQDRADYGDDIHVPPPGADEPPPPEPERAERRSLADKVLELLAELELAHDASGEAYAMPIVGGARQVLEVRSKQFRDYVRLQCFVAFNKSLSGEGLVQVVETVAARARFTAPEAEIFTRVANRGSDIWLDLGDETWRAIRITAAGWQLVDRAEVLIKRARDCQPLPIPAVGRPGALERVFDLFRLSGRERTLVRIWLLAALRGRSPFPVLVIVGEAGAGKTTFARFLLSLVDPAKSGLRAPPREDRDLVAAAKHSYVVAFENISNIGPELSDSICRLATGAGIGGRALYTDHEEVTFYAARPVLLNGIPDLPDRADLLDRSLIVTLVNVPDDKRLLEEEVLEELEALRPAALAELLEAASRGLARFPELKAELRQRRRRLPRIADPALWAEACGVAGAVEAMLAVREEGLAEAAEADPVAAAIRRIVAASGGTWTGTSAELLRQLELGLEGARPPAGWPKTPKGVTDKVRRLAPALRAIGLEVATVRIGPERVRGLQFAVREYGKRSARSARSPENGEISEADQALTGGQMAPNDLPASARICPDLPASNSPAVRPGGQICPERADRIRDLPADLPAPKALEYKENSAPKPPAGRSGRFLPILSDGHIAELVEALAHGDLARARPLFERTFGREPIGRELGELAMLDSREKIARALEALAPLEA